MDKTQVKFYFIPKERIANILDWEAQTNTDGSITSSQHGMSSDKVRLSDYLISTDIVSTPTMSAYIGKVGTKAELWGTYRNGNDYFKWLKEAMDRKLKQYEI